MNSTRRPSQRGARVLVGLIGGVVSVVGALALWNLLVPAEAFAQEPSTAPGAPAPVEEVAPQSPQEPSTTSGETAPTETVPPETVPTEVAQPKEAPKETVPKEEAPKKALTLANVWPDITGLVMQPVFLAVKLPVATVGAVVGAVLWPFSRDSAEKTWDSTVKDPWGWPDFVRRLGKPSEAAP